jgi:geranylgeranyl pyrophosphate synthase
MAPNHSLFEQKNSLFRSVGNFAVTLGICFQIRADFSGLGERFHEIPCRFPC